MTTNGIQLMLQKGEGIEVEFKEGFFELPKSVFETICAFLNRKGGHLILGVCNNGALKGVLESEAPRMVNELVSNANNPQKLIPQFYLSPEIIKYQNSTLIYCYVPQSSQVHRTAGRIFDRTAADGDIDITNQPHQVTQLYLRKQQTYTENRIYPHADIASFRPDLLQRVRSMAANQRPNHPWSLLTDQELLQSAGLYLKDMASGQEGYSLAALLLLGRDEAILSALPHHKTDALLRVKNIDRYDDRDDIRTNLIESYDRLMAFVSKHLPDPFYLLNTQRVSLRDKIFREVVANMLVHREFASGYPAKFIIETNGVHTENWSLPHAHGLLHPDKVVPFPKNPVIARFFKEIGLVDELGSGLRNAFRFVPEYSGGAKPVFEEGDVFKCFVPISISSSGQPDVANVKEEPLKYYVQTRIVDLVNDTVEATVGDSIKQRLIRMLTMLLHHPGLKLKVIKDDFTVSKRTLLVDIKLLTEKGLIERRGNSKTGGYYLTEQIKNQLVP